MKKSLALPLFFAACQSAPMPNAEHHHHHHGHGGMPHRFENAEEWAKQFDDPGRDVWQKPDEVVALLQLQPGMVVADIGAGTGYFEGRLSKGVGDAGRVWALDVEADMVRYLGERAQKEGWKNLEAKQVATDDPGLAPGSVDRILIVDTWHHLGDRDAYAKKLALALKAGGELHVVDFNKDSERGPPAEMKLAPEELQATLQKAGLQAEIATESLPDQYVVIGKKSGD